MLIFLKENVISALNKKIKSKAVLVALDLNFQFLVKFKDNFPISKILVQ